MSKHSSPALPASTRRGRSAQHRHPARFRPCFEPLEDRRLLAVTAVFNSTTGILTVTGDAANNAINISRSSAGRILVNGGSVVIQGAVPMVANTSLIQVFGRAGNDQITMNESGGPLPAARIAGGSGNDTLIGGSGADQLLGQSGSDNLQGRGGFDLLLGGDGPDTLIGGDGSDQAFGQAGNDRMIWNPGDDTDLNEGGLGTDTVQVNGEGVNEVFTTTANGARVRFDRLDPAPFSLDIGTSENLVLNAGGGNDSFSATGNLAPLIKITVDGGAGNDTLLGSNGIDFLIGGDGNDFVDGQQANDVALLGAGDDVFQWDPGDGSDVVEGQAGFDTMLFNGSGGAENFEAFANGGRVLFTRSLGTVVMDLDDVESIDLNTLGLTDTTVIHDLTGTDLVEINIDLAGTIGGSAGDGVADIVTVFGSADDDVIVVTNSAAGIVVGGLSAVVNLRNAEPGIDALVVNGAEGDDVIDLSLLAADVIRVTADGGAGDDLLIGSAGVDVLYGSGGEDFLLGGPGLDVLDGGDGDDVEIQD